MQGGKTYNFLTKREGGRGNFQILIAKGNVRFYICTPIENLISGF